MNRNDIWKNSFFFRKVNQLFNYYLLNFQDICILYVTCYVGDFEIKLNQQKIEFLYLRSFLKRRGIKQWYRVVISDVSIGYEFKAVQGMSVLRGWRRERLVFRVKVISRFLIGFLSMDRILRSQRGRRKVRMEMRMEGFFI